MSAAGAGKLYMRGVFPVATPTAAWRLNTGMAYAGNAVAAPVAGITITLPPAADATGHIYFIKKIDSSANVVTIDPSGSETIDGGLTAVLTVQYEAITIQSDGTEWWIL